MTLKRINAFVTTFQAHHKHSFKNQMFRRDQSQSKKRWPSKLQNNLAIHKRSLSSYYPEVPSQALEATTKAALGRHWWHAWLSSAFPYMKVEIFDDACHAIHRLSGSTCWVEGQFSEKIVTNFSKSSSVFLLDLVSAYPISNG